MEDSVVSQSTEVSTAYRELDKWIRGEFQEINTALEELYFAERTIVAPNLPGAADLIETLVCQGEELIAAVALESELPSTPIGRYELLGLIGFYFGACRRHEAQVDQERIAPLAQALGASLGVAPRFSSAHQHIRNRAVNGRFHSFTRLESERIFLTYNGLAVMAYRRAAHALSSVTTLGMSNPLATYHLKESIAALKDVLSHSQRLAAELDSDRFFYNIRPYFKSYRVGSAEYRGANAGDFSAINVIDVMLGLCSPRDSFYQWVVADKYPYVLPEDQKQLRNLTTAESLLSLTLRELNSQAQSACLRENAALLLAACKAHGAATVYHHNRLVVPFLEKPAAAAPPARQTDMTASGPPLSVVVAGLAKLRDLRAARDRPGLTTARSELDRVRSALDHESVPIDD